MRTYQRFLNESIKQRKKFSSIQDAVECAIGKGNILTKHKRVPEVEEYILNHENNSEEDVEEICRYAEYVIQGRWPEAEEIILNRDQTTQYLANQYLFFITHTRKDKYTDQDKWKWLKDEGITKNLMIVLSYMGIPKDMQEYIIRERPDLIGQIPNLDPELKKKYTHELNSSGVEI